MKKDSDVRVKRAQSVVISLYVYYKVISILISPILNLSEASRTNDISSSSSSVSNICNSFDPITSPTVSLSCTTGCNTEFNTAEFSGVMTSPYSLKFNAVQTCYTDADCNMSYLNVKSIKFIPDMSLLITYQSPGTCESFVQFCSNFATTQSKLFLPPFIGNELSITLNQTYYETTTQPESINICADGLTTQFSSIATSYVYPSYVVVIAGLCMALAILSDLYYGIRFSLSVNHLTSLCFPTDDLKWPKGKPGDECFMLISNSLPNIIISSVLLAYNLRVLPIIGIIITTMVSTVDLIGWFRYYFCATLNDTSRQSAEIML
jgi:hypothetical protein